MVFDALILDYSKSHLLKLNILLNIETPDY